MLTIACWNVNSIIARLDILRKWLKSTHPDIVLLQELKCSTHNFPYELIEELQYNIVTNCQKGRNGVAILSKFPIDETNVNLAYDPDPLQARYIEAVISVEGKVVRVVSVYVPNGQEVDSEKFQYKLAFFKALRTQLKQLIDYDEITVVGGDYNVAPEELDVFDPIRSNGRICFHPAERAHFRSILHLGYADAYRLRHPQGHEFTWWDYRAGAWQYNKGLRIDHLLVSPKAVDCLDDVIIDATLRNLDKPSDHTPILCTLALK